MEFNLVSYYPFVKKFTAPLSLKWLIFAQYKHSKKKAVRANDQMTEVNTEDNTKMGDHLGSIQFVFFHIRQFRKKLPNCIPQLEFWKKFNCEGCNIFC